MASFVPFVHFEFYIWFFYQRSSANGSGFGCHQRPIKYSPQEAFMSIPDSETVILITRYGMGQAEPDLQLKLIATYLKLLDENNVCPPVSVSTPRASGWR